MKENKDNYKFGAKNRQSVAPEPQEKKAVKQAAKEPETKEQPAAKANAKPTKNKPNKPSKDQ